MRGGFVKVYQAGIYSKFPYVKPAHAYLFLYLLGRIGRADTVARRGPSGVGEPMGISEIAAELGWSRQYVSELLGEMAEYGLVYLRGEGKARRVHIEPGVANRFNHLRETIEETIEE